MRIILTIIAWFMLITAVQAGDVALSWDAGVNVTGYKVYQSVDQGTTWTIVADVNTNSVTITPPNTGLVLYRVSVYSASDESIRLTSGIWYNEDWQPSQVLNLGVQ